MKLASLPGANEYNLIAATNDSVTNYRVIFGAGTIGNNELYVLWRDNSGNIIEFDSPPANYVSAGDIGNWVHIAVVVDATNQTVTGYKNGTATTLTKRSASPATTIGTTAVTWYLGQNGTGIRYLDGSLDEVAFWKNAKLTQPQTAALYSGAGATFPFATTTATQDGVVPTFLWYGTGSTTKVTTGLLGDVNGDGFPDFVQSIDAALSGISRNSTYLGNGSAWSAGTTTLFIGAKQLPTATSTMTNSMLIDINGDRLADWVYSSTTATRPTSFLITGRVGNCHRMSAGLSARRRSTARARRHRSPIAASASLISTVMG